MSRRQPPISADAPVIAPTDGLRQRQRANGTWRIWWEPSARQAKLGAKPVDLSHLRGGEAQRRASALTKEWGGDTAPPPARAQTMASLIADYMASHWYKNLRASTRSSYLSNLRTIEDKWGPQPAALITKPVVIRWYETLLAARGTNHAHVMITMLRIVFEHGLRRGWLPSGANPAANIGMAKPTPQATRVASDAEIDALLNAADAANPALALALRLSVTTGQRIEDIRAAHPSHFEPALIPVPGRTDPVQGYIWRMVRSKRGNAAVIPIIDARLVDALRAAIASADVQALGAVLLNGNGQPYTRRRLALHFDAVRARAARALPTIAGLQWRDLRRTMGVRLRIANIGRDDVGDLLGNTLASNPDLAARYTPAQWQTTLRAVAVVSNIDQPERKKA